MFIYICILLFVIVRTLKRYVPVTVSDGQIPKREQTHGTVQGAEPDRGADKDVVPEQADQVEEAVGVQAQGRPPARLLPAGAALRFAVRAALLLPSGRGRGSGSGGGGHRRRLSELWRYRVAAAPSPSVGVRDRAATS